MIVSSARGPRLVRAAAVAAVGACAAFVATACNDLIAGDRASVAEQLCEQLGDCYGRDAYPCDGMVDRLRAAGDYEREAFLDAYSEEACLGSCPRSLACLDHEPFCARGPGSGCDAEQDCCDWSQGLSACRAGGCCAPLGVRCGGEGDLDCCDSLCIDGYCGGEACVLVGETCRRGDECCSRRCEEGVCAAKTCAELGAACKSDADCCNPPSGVVFADAATTVACDQEANVCVLESVETCVDAGAPCDPAGSGVPCCGELGLVCVPGLDGGICGAPGCTGAGTDCAFDEQCCADLICDYSLGEPRCASKPFECGKAGEACGECCPGRECLSGFCSEANGTGCAPSACHDPESIGAPMAAGTCSSEPYFCCADFVANNDPFCGCIAWDVVCAETAKTACASFCQ